MGPEQLALLIHQAVEVESGPVQLASREGDQDVEALPDVALELFAPLGRQLNARVVLDHFGFDDCDPAVRLVAAAELPVAAQEVVVAAAVAAVSAEHQAVAAAAAVDAPLQVVSVDPVPLASQLVIFEHGLDSHEQLLGDDHLVPPRMRLAGVPHDAHVVVVMQDLTETLGVNHPRRVAPGGPGPQSSLLKNESQFAQAEAAGAVQLEGQQYELPALRVQGDIPHLVAVDHGADVQVADRCPAGRAADVGFLLQAAADLDRQLAPVMGSHGGQDAEHQQAARAVVDRLAGAGQLNALSLQQAVGHPEIFLVAGPARDVPDDHQIEVMLGLQILKELLEGDALEY